MIMKRFIKKDQFVQQLYPYDLLGIVSYIINQKMTIAQAYDLLDNSQIKFDGIDGKFSFVENVIFRELGYFENCER